MNKFSDVKVLEAELEDVKAELKSVTGGRNYCIDRLAKAEALLSRAHPGMHTCETNQWFTDRDTFLNPKPQDVK